MKMHDPNPNDEELKAPPGLVTALKQAGRRQIFIPPTVDERIVRSARRHFARPERRRPFWLRLVFWSTAPATLLALIIVLRHPAPPFAREDLNHDGKVDILDAFLLARELRSGQPPAGRDVNGDGVIDEKDIAQIATHAVTLAKGRRS